MPNNFLMASCLCPHCAVLHEHVGFEFVFGSLAGETYELGDAVRFEEGFSFFGLSSVGVAQGRHEIDAMALCPSCDEEIHARLIIEEGVLMALVDGNDHSLA